MKLATRRTTAVLTVATAAGASTLFGGAAPAFAASEACGPNDGVVVGPGVCELQLTSGSSTFTRTADMTTLEALLVGGGGNGAQRTNTGYASAAAGGGGEVVLVDFSAATAPIAVTVGGTGVASSATSGSTSAVAEAGAIALDNSYSGGVSGSGNGGSQTTFTAPDGSGGTINGAYGAGGGAGGPATGANGGAGVVVDDLAPAGSLFAGDARCFGGGGAVGVALANVHGVAGCGAGGPQAGDLALVAPAANSGGGGGSLDSLDPVANRAGASGTVILRWNAAPVTVVFDVRGIGTAPAAQTIPAGATATAPAAPTATGYSFEGWYLDAAFTMPADFAAPVTAGTTLYARWVPVLAESGADAVAATQLGIAGAATLAAGLVLTMVAARRRRES